MHRLPRYKVSACRSRGVFVAAEPVHALAAVLERNTPDTARWKFGWTCRQAGGRAARRRRIEPFAMPRQDIFSLPAPAPALHGTKQEQSAFLQ